MSVTWKHEFDQDQREVDVSFVDDANSVRFSYETEEPDRDFFELSFGFSLILPDDVHAFINYRSLIGHEYIYNNVLAIGLRMGI